MLRDGRKQGQLSNYKTQNSFKELRKDYMKLLENKRKEAKKGKGTPARMAEQARDTVREPVLRTFPHVVDNLLITFND